MWSRGDAFLSHVTDLRDQHLEQAHLDTWADDAGRVYAATLSSVASIDWRIGFNWGRTTPTAVVRRGAVRVGSWLLNVKTVGLADDQLLAARQILDAVVTGSGVLVVGRLGRPHLELAGVHPRWDRSTTEAGTKLAGGRTRTALPAWW